MSSAPDSTFERVKSSDLWAARAERLRPIYAIGCLRKKCDSPERRFYSHSFCSGFLVQDLFDQNWVGSRFVLITLQEKELFGVVSRSKPFPHFCCNRLRRCPRLNSQCDAIVVCRRIDEPSRPLSASPFLLELELYVKPTIENPIHPSLSFSHSCICCKSAVMATSKSMGTPYLNAWCKC